MYIASLCLMWGILWVLAALSLGPVPEWLMPRDDPRRRPWSAAGVWVWLLRHRRIVLATASAWFLVGYVLGFAPTRQALATGRLPAERNMLDFYVPVEWAIDHTPLREPLLAWADVWRQRDTLESESERRMSNLFWRTQPAWHYALCWLVAGLACVFGPAVVLRVAGNAIRRASRPPADPS